MFAPRAPDAGALARPSQPPVIPEAGATATAIRNLRQSTTAEIPDTRFARSGMTGDEGTACHLRFCCQLHGPVCHRVLAMGTRALPWLATSCSVAFVAWVPEIRFANSGMTFERRRCLHHPSSRNAQSAYPGSLPCFCPRETPDSHRVAPASGRQLKPSSAGSGRAGWRDRSRAVGRGRPRLSDGARC